jgi:hypothetical protein
MFQNQRTGESDGLVAGIPFCMFFINYSLRIIFFLLPIIKRVTHPGITIHIMTQKYTKHFDEWLSPLFYSPEDRDSNLISDNECSWIFRCFLQYVILNNGIKGKGKVQPITGHQGPRGRVEV